MNKYCYSKEELALIENNPFPFVIYQYLDSKMVTVAVSGGFLEMFGFKDRQEAFDKIDNEMYMNTHSDDIARIADSAYRFAANGEEYKVHFRIKIKGQYRNVKAIGKHINKPGGYSLAMVTYTDEGPAENSAEKGSKQEIRHYVITNFNKALNEGWIKVYYQAIVRASNGRVCEEEALSRWIDPDRGIIMPDEFIPVLEESGLVYKLDLYVTDLIIRKLKDQEEAGLYVVPQTLNLSRTDFYSCDIVEEIRRRMDEAGIEHSKLTIEITESVIGKDVDFMTEQIERFQALGFKIWMDDYGSGYSSPELLQKIHFDTIKFDMQYIRHINESDANRIILTELIKMAVALNIDTVVEGVETKEQAEFLKEIGCAKLQGYYYVKPIPMEEIIERYRKGIQIGFENPKESDYYSIIGKVNLYDLTFTEDDDNENLLNNYFNTIPMAIMEMNETDHWIVRANPSYKEFFSRNFDIRSSSESKIESIDEFLGGRKRVFIKALKQCALDGKRVILDERSPDGEVAHILIRRVAVNLVTNVVAFVVMILGVEGVKNKENFSYNYIAQTLSSDYMSLYYVDLDTDNFVEYSSGVSYDDLSIERHGRNFFEHIKNEGIVNIYSEDIDEFTSSFTKEKILDALNKNGVYTLTTRIVEKGEPIYIHLKAVRIKTKGNEIIIGISNIDAQKKQQESFERIKEEQITYSRIAALSGNYVVIFTINPYTSEYTTYTHKERKIKSGLPLSGYHFLDNFKIACKVMVHPEDLDRVIDELNMENIKKQIEQTGIFSTIYREMRGGEAKYVMLRVALVDEKDGKKLLFGIMDINEQIRREQEAASKLTAARNEANLDALTGVKNKHAYIDVEAQIDSLIEQGEPQEFAIVVMDINGLKMVNDTKGHQAGDEYIRQGCNIICKIFRHSPVYRVGGDEFAVFAQGSDYNNIDKLMDLLNESNIKNKDTGEVVIAGGMARYRNERCVADVFSKADANMYQNKRLLKL